MAHTRTVGATLVIFLCLAGPSLADECAAGGITANGVRLDLQGEEHATVELLQVQADRAQAERRVGAGAQPALGHAAGAEQAAAAGASTAAGATAASVSERQIPGLGNIINNIPQGIVDEVNNVANREAINGLVQVLNSTLLQLEEKASTLLSQCKEFKDSLVQNVSASGGDAIGTLQSIVAADLGLFMQVWTPFNNILSAAIPTLTGALSGLGQTDVAEALRAALERVLADASTFNGALENATELITHVGDLTRQKKDELMANVDSTLQVALDKVGALEHDLSQGLEDLLRSLSQKLGIGLPETGADSRPDEAGLGDLLSRAKGLAGTISEALRTFVSGISEATRIATAEPGRGQAGSAFSGLGLCIATAAAAAAAAA